MPKENSHNIHYLLESVLFKIRHFEHFFFLPLCNEHCFWGSKALLLSGRSNAPLAEKHCPADYAGCFFELIFRCKLLRIN